MKKTLRKIRARLISILAGDDLVVCINTEFDIHKGILVIKDGKHTLLRNVRLLGYEDGIQIKLPKHAGRNLQL